MTARSDERCPVDDPVVQDRPDVLEFRLPDLGEGLTEAELVAWTVSVGDTVELNQTIAEVETAKAQVALPSPFAGRVVGLLANPGDTVAVGAPLIRVASSEEGSDAGSTPVVAPNLSAAMPATDTSVLVGYGPATEPTPQRTRRLHGPPTVPPTAYPQLGARPPATPAARKLARELGIDIAGVTGSGMGGAVTIDDVRRAMPLTNPAPRPRPDTEDDTTARPAVPPVPMMRPESGPARQTPAQRENRTPISGIRKRTATAMVTSAQTIPQASAFVSVDFTASMELLDHLRRSESFAGASLTPLALVAKATLAALAEFPAVNSFWDEQNQEIVTKNYVNLGIAVATERGLLVPNIKEAQTQSLRQLCHDIAWLAEVARGGTATPADLTGGTFTISNVGVFGVDTGVPLVNPGEAAILCLGSIRKRPWVYRDEPAVRWVTTLGLSFDHRMIDGELGSRFLATVAALVEDPLALLSRV